MLVGYLFERLFRLVLCVYYVYDDVRFDFYSCLVGVACWLVVLYFRLFGLVILLVFGFGCCFGFVR